MYYIIFHAIIYKIKTMTREHEMDIVSKHMSNHMLYMCICEESLPNIQTKFLMFHHSKKKEEEIKKIRCRFLILLNKS